MGISGFPGVHEAVDGEVFELVTNKATGINNSSQESTTSILGKFFGSTSTVKDAGFTGFVEVFLYNLRLRFSSFFGLKL